MSAIAIVTDSTAYIPNDLVRKYGIHVAPQILIWGEETIRDGVDIMPEAFYERLKTATVMPTTSQVTIAYFHELFQKLAAEGKQILAVLVSSKLSGTISSAVQAKEMLPQAQIEIVDSLSTAMALGFQVLAAARADEAGKNFAQVAEVARSGAAHTGIVIAVETLEFLHRGGRIGGAARLLGTALNLKPVLELVDGRDRAGGAYSHEGQGTCPAPRNRRRTGQGQAERAGGDDPRRAHIKRPRSCSSLPSNA